LPGSPHILEEAIFQILNMRSNKGKILTDVILEIFRLHGILLTEGDELSGKVGLSSARWEVLGAIALNGGELTVSQISKIMGQARQSVQRIATSIADEGYLSWHENPNHKRAKLLRLTSKGKTAYERLEEIQAPWVNSLAEPLSVAELESTLKNLKKLVHFFD